MSNGAGQFGWNFNGALPFGGIGILAIAVVAMVSFTLGQFTFLGLQFLAHRPPPLFGGGMTVLIASSALWAVVIECLIWRGRWLQFGLQFARSPSRPPMPSSIDWAALGWLAAVLIIIFLGICAIWHRQYQCLLVAMPVLALLVFAITAYGQVPIIRALRGAGRDRAAFATLLVLAAIMTFLTGELMTVDAYRKGLEHFRNDHSAISTISGQANFFFDYERRELVLKTHPGAAEPLDIHRSFADFECK